MRYIVLIRYSSTLSLGGRLNRDVILKAFSNSKERKLRSDVAFVLVATY